VTPRPTRTTSAGRAYLDLQNLARRTQRPTEELHQLYVLECFLDRLAGSAYADRFVLKGGVLLAAYDMRRPTRDVDLRADRLAATPEAVLEAIISIAARPLDDGIVFDTAQARAETITPTSTCSPHATPLTATNSPPPSRRLPFIAEPNCALFSPN
jgi:hypothetical protein